jgi:hypothetical protein
MATAREIIEDMREELLAAGLFGTETVVLRLPGLSAETVTAAWVSLAGGEVERQEGGEVVRVDGEVRLLESALSATLQALDEERLAQALVTHSGEDYQVQRAHRRDEVWRLYLRRLAATERARPGYRSRT